MDIIFDQRAHADLALKIPRRKSITNDCGYTPERSPQDKKKKNVYEEIVSKRSLLTLLINDGMA
jgi:hypothetical protein